jgi:leucyl/phenylalanyl-tRNA---protein transferase
VIAYLPPGSEPFFPSPDRALRVPNGLLAAGGELSADWLLHAYRRGIFPWYSEGQPILWWSPDPRMVFATDGVHVPARLRRWLRQCDWLVRADAAFTEVVDACAAPRAGQGGTWITPAMRAAYVDLRKLGHAHSIEVYDGEKLVGGIYGIAIGCMFFGESMFSRQTHASKVALIALARCLQAWGFPLLDAQVSSAHLQTLGGFEMPRRDFVAQVTHLCAQSGLDGRWERHWPPLVACNLA